MSKLFSLFILSSLFYSCQKQVEIQIPKSPPKLVVNCLFTQDSIFKVQLASSSYIFDTTYRYIDNATVNLFANNILIEKLNYKGKGKYETATYTPNTHIKYRIEISAEGYETVFASSELPPKVQINNINANIYSQETDNNELYSNIQIEFSDPDEIKNFYELLIPYNYEEYNIIQNPDLCFEPDELINDTICKHTSSGFAHIYSNSPVFSTIFTSRKKTIFENYIPAVFSDNLFNGENYTVNVDFLDGSYNLPDTAKFNILLNSISEDFFKYLSVKSINQNTSGNEFLDELWDGWQIDEPIQMYSNVKNGYGIFAGYNLSIDSIFYIKALNKK